MFKALYDRFAYAFIGFVFGAVLAVVLWFLYDKGFSRRAGPLDLHFDLKLWVKYVGGAFAMIGFLFQDRVGSLFGGSVAEVYDYEAKDRHFPAWLVIVAVLGIAVVAWHFSH